MLSRPAWSGQRLSEAHGTFRGGDGGNDATGTASCRPNLCLCDADLGPARQTVGEKAVSPLPGEKRENSPSQTASPTAPPARAEEGAMTENHQLQAVVHGHVQGVSFRY